MQYYVDAAAARPGCGDKDHPFLTISAAAAIASPGDEILVAPGIYREYVDPRNGGTEKKRIVYRSIEPLGAVITGAELLTGWKKVEGENNVWTTRVKNTMFGDYNPYTTMVSGDWFVAMIKAHTGDIYLNNKSMYEVYERDKVANPEPYRPSWEVENTVYVWYTEQDEATNETVFYANFQGKDPEKELVEFSVRKDCFLPSETGRNYITLSGFTVCKAATQWAPPTAYQDGMVGPHWSKGWIIENCEIYESKCSGISLGKYYQEGNDNKWGKTRYKDGTQTQRDCVCIATYEGWDKEHVGSHIVRGCNIHDCGQTGIVGHMGSAFCIIEDNHIHHINYKRNLDGAEIGGIKFHAAVDTTIRRNHIHNCSRGIWLDWQAQGTRVSQNLMHDNCLAMDRSGLTMDDMGWMTSLMGEDIFIEVSHGPTLVDNNILLSERSIKFAAQGGAFVHNLFGGSIACIGRGTRNGAPDLPSDRYTPYHEKHGTKIVGFMTFLHGDARFYNNIFVQKPVYPLFAEIQKYQEEHPDDIGAMWDDMNYNSGTFVYNGYPDFDTWNSWFDEYCGMGCNPTYPNKYYDHLPVWSEGNVYFGGAKPWEKEKAPVVDDSFEVKLELVEKDGAYSLDTNIYDHLPGQGVGVITTATLGQAFEPEQAFENTDGSPITFDQDYFGAHRAACCLAGPFADAAKAKESL